MDELFEILTLAQTRKLESKMVIVLYGTKFWNGILNFEALVEHGTIDREDLRLFQHADDPETALGILQEQLTRYFLEPEKPLPEVFSLDTAADDALHGDQVGDVLERMIAALPEKLRQPLILSTIEEMSPREVAATLGINEAAVRSRVFRARQILRDKLAGRVERKMSR